jgi:hypothetical protein
MSGRENSLFVNQPFFSSLGEIGPEDFIVGNDTPCHEPDDPSQMSVPSLADLALSFVLA